MFVTDDWRPKRPFYFRTALSTVCPVKPHLNKTTNHNESHFSNRFWGAWRHWDMSGCSWHFPRVTLTSLQHCPVTSKAHTLAMLPSSSTHLLPSHVHTTLCTVGLSVMPLHAVGAFGSYHTPTSCSARQTSLPRSSAPASRLSASVTNPTVFIWDFIQTLALARMA